MAIRHQKCYKFIADSTEINDLNNLNNVHYILQRISSSHDDLVENRVFLSSMTLHSSNLYL